MNINQVGKLFNDIHNQEVRTLELRVGQVVRGVVTQQLPNQEALVNINGIQVKAKLEVPIMEGKAALMEVAPDSKSGYIHLRQIDPSQIGMQDPMKDILKAMHLPDKEWTSQLVRELRQEGFPLNRDTLQAFAQAVKLLPANTDLESWMQAATLAFKRGMPMTLSSISAMHQLGQGQPLHQLINQLQQQLQQLLQTQGQTLSSQSTQVLQHLSQSLSQLMSQSVTSSLHSQTEGQAITQHVTNQNNNSTNQAQGQLQGQALQQSQSTVPQNPIVSFMRLLGVQHEQALGQRMMQNGMLGHASGGEQTSTQMLGQHGTAQNTLQSTGNSVNGAPYSQLANQGTVLQNSVPQATVQQLATGVQQGGQQPLQSGQRVTTLNGQLQNQALAQQGGQQTVQSGGQQATIISNQPNLSNATVQPPAMNQDGVMQQGQQQSQNTVMVQGQQQSQNTVIAQGQQQVTSHQTTLQQTQSTMNQLAPIFQAEAQANGLQASQNLMNHMSDSVKANLLQLLQSIDVPASIKDTATQFVNHITGQQMMLSTERNQSMFTHITMFVPIKDDNGEQTAAIHVQTRRDRKGQLDAENCRIVFDLNMLQLGQTLVDMNVVNKIVSLNIWNDVAYIQPLLDSMRSEIVEAMHKTGYSLSSIRATPFKQDNQHELEEVKAIVTPPDVQHMNNKRYKGVDMKV